MRGDDRAHKLEVKRSELNRPILEGAMDQISHLRGFRVRAGRQLSVLILSAFAVSGCALPPAIEVATLVLGGSSWLVTGKGLSDHAVSAAVDKDCAMVRPVLGQRFCMTHDEAALRDAEVRPVEVAGLRLKGIEQFQDLAGDGQTRPRDLEMENEFFELAAIEFDHESLMSSYAPLPEEGFSPDDLEVFAAALNDLETAAGVTVPTSPTVSSPLKPQLGPDH